MSNPEVKTPPINLEIIKSVVKQELTNLDQLISESLTSKVPLVKTVLSHIVKSGGKRIRPLLVLLIAKCLNQKVINEHYELATIIEFVHTATLLHDDVIDNSNLRRGQPTANHLWGNQAAILVGDFLYSRAFQLLTSRCNSAVMQALASTTNAISEGEVMQLCHQGQIISKKDYFEVIERKTAILFASACECSAIISPKGQDYTKACYDFGLNLGIAFQIIDDILDYTADSNKLGKNIGNDISEGKMTLPLIYAYENANASQQHTIKQAIHNKQGNTLDITAIINSSKAIIFCQDNLNRHCQRAVNALAQLPDNPCREALFYLIDFTIKRNN